MPPLRPRVNVIREPKWSTRIFRISAGVIEYCLESPSIVTFSPELHRVCTSVQIELY
jgi:hypothetical protein